MSDETNESNPYRAPQAAIEPFAANDALLAGRLHRLAAVLIDGLIAAAVILPLMYFAGYLAEAMSAAASGAKPPLTKQLLWGAMGFGLFVVVQGYPLNATGQTWGKRALGIKIVDLEGRKPALMHLLALRYFPIRLISTVPVAGPLLATINLLLIFRSDRRCGHDLIAGTRVVVAR